MKKPQILIYYFGAFMLAALVVVCLYDGIRGRSASVQHDDNAAPAYGPSYEQTVSDQQKRWGHGHTLGDPSPTTAGSQAPSGH